MDSGKNNIWGILALGVLLAVSSLYTLITVENGYIWRGVYIPVWPKYFLFPIGVFLVVIAIRGILRGKKTPEPPADIDEAAARAEAELDAMYLREHGELPKKPEKPETDMEQ